jgi:hypothetical protein
MQPVVNILLICYVTREDILYMQPEASFRIVRSRSETREDGDESDVIDDANTYEKFGASVGTSDPQVTTPSDASANR